jgi:tetratricopeptide (TPR) repeat protein
MNETNMREKAAMLEKMASIYTSAFGMTDEAEMYITIGETCEGKGDAAAAFLAYSYVINLKPNDTKGYHKRGSLYAKNGMFDSAIDDFTTIIGIQHDDDLAYLSRATNYLSKDEHARAIADYNKAISLSGKPGAHSYYLRGNAYKKAGEIDHAIADFTQAINLKPDFANAYTDRAVCYSSPK